MLAHSPQARELFYAASCCTKSKFRHCRLQRQTPFSTRARKRLLSISIISEILHALRSAAMGLRSWRTSLAAGTGSQCAVPWSWVWARNVPDLAGPAPASAPRCELPGGSFARWGARLRHLVAMLHVLVGTFPSWMMGCCWGGSGGMRLQLPLPGGAMLGRRHLLCRSRCRQAVLLLLATLLSR